MSCCPCSCNPPPPPPHAQHPPHCFFNTHLTVSSTPTSLFLQHPPHCFFSLFLPPSPLILFPFCSQSDAPHDLSLTACLKRLVDPRTGRAPCRNRLLAEVGNQVGERPREDDTAAAAAVAAAAATLPTNVNCFFLCLAPAASSAAAAAAAAAATCVCADHGA